MEYPFNILTKFIRLTAGLAAWIPAILCLFLLLLTSGCLQTTSSSKSNTHAKSKEGPGMGYPEPQPGMLLPEVLAMKGEPEMKREAVYRGRPVTVYLYRDPLPGSIRTDITGSEVDYVYDPNTQRAVEVEVPRVESIRIRRFLITQVVFHQEEVVAVDYSHQAERDY